jgi:hypothetical protein
VQLLSFGSYTSLDRPCDRCSKLKRGDACCDRTEADIRGVKRKKLAEASALQQQQQQHLQLHQQQSTALTASVSSLPFLSSQIHLAVDGAQTSPALFMPALEHLYTSLPQQTFDQHLGGYNGELLFSCHCSQICSRCFAELRRSAPYATALWRRSQGHLQRRTSPREACVATLPCSAAHLQTRLWF